MNEIILNDLVWEEVGKPNLDRILQFAGAPENEYTQALARHWLNVLSALSTEGIILGNPWAENKFDGLGELLFKGDAGESDDATARAQDWARQARDRSTSRLDRSWEKIKAIQEGRK